MISGDDLSVPTFASEQSYNDESSKRQVQHDLVTLRADAGTVFCFLVFLFPSMPVTAKRELRQL